MDRRWFLKMAALTLGGAAVPAFIKGGEWVEASEFIKSQKALKAEKWSMAIDVSKLGSQEDYRRCIDACHRTHNVPDFGGTRHEVKWIWSESFQHTFPYSGHKYINKSVVRRPFLVLCNHCEHPPCVRVCPTKATYKTAEGAVVVDFHRCIGCRYCMAACPYGARSFNWFDPRKGLDGLKINREFPTRTMGVVEKCNFCTERLAKGLGPACAEASKGAIVYGDLRDPGSDVRRVLSSRFTMLRKPALGTEPSVYYVIGGGAENA